jgi:hypothetical protein
LIPNWYKLALESALLGFEAQQVIGLRLIKLAHGGTAAHTEAVRMITEKVIAASEGLGVLATAGSGRRIIRRYRARVKANKRRLSRTA